MTVTFKAIRIRNGLSIDRLLAVVLALGLIQPAALSAQSEPERPSFDERVSGLEPGDYWWADAVAPTGPLLVVVSLPAQRMFVYRNGVPIAVSTVSTGTADHQTPTGVFTVLQKREEHYSNIYDDAPMPYMQRLTWTGIAIHAGAVRDGPASHGCIRLPDEFARLLFETTSLGITVIVTDASSVPRIAPAPQFLEGDDGRLAFDHYELAWHPELSPAGPVSIIVSEADREIRVLRNGIEIGSAPAILRREVAGTEVYSLETMNAAEDRFEWVRVPLSEESPDAAPVTVDERAQLVIADAFRERLVEVLSPGTVAVITKEGLLPDTHSDFQIMGTQNEDESRP